MDPILIDRWTRGLAVLPTLDEASVAVARQEVRAAGAAIGMSEVEIGSLALVVSELGMNQLVHGRDGVVAIRPITRGGAAGLEIVAADRGGGIADLTAAIEGTGAKKGLGVGLSSVLRLSQEVDLDVRLGEGTCIWARRFKGSVPRRREVAILGRPHRGERVSGDDAIFVRRDEELIVAVADGLGHGPEAREASSRAIEASCAYAARAPDEILGEADAALARTRGAVMSVARVDEHAGQLSFSGVGNGATQLYRLDGTGRSFSGPGFVLGVPGGHRPRLLDERAPIAGDDVLVMFSDGLRSSARFTGDRSRLRQHPILLAHGLLEEFGRDDDDATVLVVA